MKKTTFILIFLVFLAALLVWVGFMTKQANQVKASNIGEITTKWEGSGHADSESEAFTHWNEDDPAEVPAYCARCHSTSGFRDFVGADGSAPSTVDAPGRINDPINCTACHNQAVHALDQATFQSGASMAGTGMNSSCMSCHGGMGSGAAVAKTIDGLPLDEAMPDQTMMNNHYQAAASVNAGADGGDGYEYEGKTYVGKFRHAPTADTCLACHDPHSTHIRKAQNGETSLCTTCHSTVESYQDYKTVSMSKTDFDGDGTVEAIYDEIEGVKAILHDAINKYTAATGSGDAWGYYSSYPYAFIDTNKDGILSEDEATYPNMFKNFTPRSLRAAYNFMYVQKEPGAYVHNAKYVLQLMYDSIEDLSEISGVTTQGLTRP